MYSLYSGGRKKNSWYQSYILMIKQFWNPACTCKNYRASLSWQYDFSALKRDILEVKAVWPLYEKQISKKRVVCLIFHNLFGFVLAFSFLKDYYPNQILLCQNLVLKAGIHVDHKRGMLFNPVRPAFPCTHCSSPYFGHF